MPQHSFQIRTALSICKDHVLFYIFNKVNINNKSVVFNLHVKTMVHGKNFSLKKLSLMQTVSNFLTLPVYSVYE